MTNRIRIGIDVGGTFTKAVALDISNCSVVGKVTVPTTHGSKEGVSTGIIRALTNLVNQCNLQHSQIELIAHSQLRQLTRCWRVTQPKLVLLVWGLVLKNQVLSDVQIFMI